MQNPSVGDLVLYASYGTPGGEYTSESRAAIVTEVDPANPDRVGLCVLNPAGLLFRSLADGGCEYHDGGETPGDPDCPEPHGEPFRYCPRRGCGWREPSLHGGTWHWPPRV